MVNNCFLCLQICRTRRCKTCSLVCHNICWVNFKNKSGNPDSCPQCRKLLDIKLHNTRTKILNNKEFSFIIRKCLEVNRLSPNSTVKVAQVIKLYTTIAENTWFLDNNQIFNDVARKKLLSFIYDEGWYEGVELYERIWNSV